jgi:hypothetical protein
MKRIHALLLSGLLLFVAVAPAQQQLFRDIEAILTDLREITGLKPLKAVPHQSIAKEEVKKFLEERLKEEIKPADIRAEELTLKKFGLVPQDFDLSKTMIELLTEQAAAFYDYRKKRLYVLDSAPEALQQVALVHELAHALADQHFNLDKYMQRASENDDGAMARMAVMEGQATWLMSEYMARRMGMSLKTSPGIVQLMGGQAAAAGQFPVYDEAPLYIRETLMFPYTKGILFQHAVIEKYGQAGFQRVFERPPASTQQVIHPEKYIAGNTPADPSLPALSTQGEYRVLVEGSIGELDHDILLRQHLGAEAAKSIPEAWRGGNYRLLEHKKNSRTVLEYASEWADAATAKEFFGLYRRVLQAKWKTMAVSVDEGARVAGRGDDGYFDLRLAATKVTCVEGMGSPEEAKPNLR